MVLLSALALMQSRDLPFTFWQPFPRSRIEAATTL
jgi:hypothetical protein